MPAVYAMLCGMLVYMAILAIFGRRMAQNRVALAFGSLALALSFAMLALSTSGLIRHGAHTLLTRVGFVGYGISLLFCIGRYWYDAWQVHRKVRA